MRSSSCRATRSRKVKRVLRQQMMVNLLKTILLALCAIKAFLVITVFPSASLFSRWWTRTASTRNVHQSTEMAGATCDPKIPNKLFMQQRQHHLLNIQFTRHLKKLLTRSHPRFIFIFMRILVTTPTSLPSFTLLNVVKTIKYQSIASNPYLAARRIHFRLILIPQLSTIS